MGATERIFEMMKYLCRVRHATMPELADKFGVSVRTIKRDIAELGYLIPLEIKSGRYEGGVYVMEDYRWDKAYMTVEDIALLIKIKAVGANKQKLVLEGDELQRLGQIIITYWVGSGAPLIIIFFRYADFFQISFRKIFSLVLYCRICYNCK